MNTITVTLPWPPAECSPNWRGHWAKRNQKVQEYKQWAYWYTQETLGENIPILIFNDSLYIRYVLHPPDKRRRDLDNFVARCKPGIDGLFELFATDDSDIKRTTAEWGEVVKGGEVKITIGLMESEE